MDYVYMVKCADNTYYTGWTTDPQNRIKTHNSGKGAKYTRPRLPVELIYLEQLPSKHAALSREIAIKKLTRREKDVLVTTYHHATHNHPPFTPICWISWQAIEPNDHTFYWNSEDAIASSSTTSSVLIDLFNYPLKIKKTTTKRKKAQPQSNSHPPQISVTSADILTIKSTKKENH